MDDVVIAGGGISGSSLALFLSSKGFSVRVYDLAPTYRKACGDAVTLHDDVRRLVEESGSVVGYVRRYRILVEGRLVAELSFRGPVWAIVDKSSLVSWLREAAESEGAVFVRGPWRGERGRITVDARGPYSRPLNEAILVYRMIARARWDGDLAVLDFRPSERGLYWVFPADGEGRSVNIGAGFDGVSSALVHRERVARYYKGVFGSKPDVVDERGAPMQVFAPIEPYSDGVFRVGEAGGFLVRTGGEGNRPGIQSSMALSRAIDEYIDDGVESVREAYTRLASSLIDEVRTSIVLLRIVERSRPDRASKILRSLPQDFWRTYVMARVSSRYVIGLFGSRPLLALRIARSLVASLA